MPAVLAVVFFVVVVVSNLVPLQVYHVRQTRIPRSSIEDIRRDTAEQELTSTHDADGPLAVLDSDDRQPWVSDDDPMSTLERREQDRIPGPPRG